MKISRHILVQLVTKYIDLTKNNLSVSTKCSMKNM